MTEAAGQGMKNPVSTLAWLQALRGLAALAVVLFHFKEPLGSDWPGLVRSFTSGSIGVDIFFILSGFIICHSTRSLESQQSLSFLVRRFSRIMLPAWVAMFCMALVKPPYLKDLIYGALFVLPQGWAPPSYGYGFLIVAWTLTYELYFYGVFAIALVLSKRLGVHRALMVTLLISATMFGLQAWLGGFTLMAHGHESWRELPDVHGASWLGVAANPMVLEFLLGVGLALVYQRWFVRMPWRLLLAMAAVSACGALAWLGVIVGENGEMQHGPWWAGGPSLLTVLAALALQRLDEIRFEGRVLSQGLGRFCVYLGDASYSLYLLHPVIKAVLHVFGEFAGWKVGPWLSVMGVLLSVTLAVVFYRKVEVPSQDFGRRWARQLNAMRGRR
jgi:peptidoglycan/LPS O-acetylase OafA/YrhL